MAATGQISTRMTVDRTLSSSRNAGLSLSPSPQRTLIGVSGRSGIVHRQLSLSVRSINTNEDSRKVKVYAENGAFDLGVMDPSVEPYKFAEPRTSHNDSRRKTKIVCTIGPSSSSREMIWKLAEAGMNVARLNMSHGDHASHQITIDLVKEYNSLFVDKAIAIMLDTKGPEVRSGDVPQPIFLEEGQEFNFTIKRGVSMKDTVSVNYDDFVNDVEVGDILLVDGGMMSLAVKSKTSDLVKCVVIDGGELQSRRHLNVRGKSATLPSITDKDWEDIKFGVDNQVDFYAVSFVKDAKVVHELKNYLKMREGADAIMLSGETAHGKFPLKAVNVMHTVALRTEASLPVRTSAIRTTAYKGRMGQMFAFHASIMANTLNTPIIVFTRTGSMAVLLSHYRPSSTIFAFTNQRRIMQRLALYQGVMPIYMEFSDDAEDTYARSLKLLQDESMLKEGQHVTLVQSGAQPIWREESTHLIQVRKIKIG
ncbi:hypothetical protein DY000_02048898 [Brassica cretica]|uniref:Pyruvate kinase n=1 Tax=Brassica cretica TaxID=69181 RepID=A0ABQ7F554_BRACR|nr:hypothetical protein DY000_02048898 [Brassica cretica]